ncbi:uncharacterized protein OCT59_004463 [Rhizophagus irregularis]|uniref:Uncharacterized protein n=1 Tax=Rhizophagus irregularis (strain DAOM 197198w) TaxID=1432141 RepID=A0A015K299_RHIIW|nr:hypothetical protein RirG_037730 [Rhizophagus irregularis DAOM 197198w]UZO12956.1 hypothetical protein OCT59_004463 [Rhizophagus irregularis]
MKPDMSHGNYQKAVIMSAKPQASDFKPITKPDPELIIKSVLDTWKFRNSFRGGLIIICSAVELTMRWKTWELWIT